MIILMTYFIQKGQLLWLELLSKGWGKAGQSVPHDPTRAGPGRPFGSLHQHRVEHEEPQKPPKKMGGDQQKWG